MDIDCDGNIEKNNDGRCDNAHDIHSRTAFKSYVSAYSNGVPDLNPFVHDYVVFGNTNAANRPDWPTFDPRDQGMKPLSVMAVVCGNKLVCVFVFVSLSSGINKRIFVVD